MKRFIIALCLALIMMTIIIIGSDCIVFVRLLIDGRGFDIALSRMNVDAKSFVIALVPGVAIFVLSLVGGPRKRPPH